MKRHSRAMVTSGLAVTPLQLLVAAVARDLEAKAAMMRGTARP